MYLVNFGLSRQKANQSQARFFNKTSKWLGYISSVRLLDTARLLETRKRKCSPSAPKKLSKIFFNSAILAKYETKTLDLYSTCHKHMKISEKAKRKLYNFDAGRF